MFLFFVVELVFVLAFGIVDDVFLIHITCFIIMLVEYRNEIYRRKERLGLSFCNKCPLKEFVQIRVILENSIYLSCYGHVTLSTSEIFTYESKEDKNITRFRPLNVLFFYYISNTIMSRYIILKHIYTHYL